MLEEFLYELAKLWPIFMSNVKESKRFNFTHYIFYFISLNWCYSYQVYNNLCNFSNSVNISERVRSELLLLILLHLHSTFERMLRIWFRKCQEKIISNTFYYLLDIMNRYVQTYLDSVISCLFTFLITPHNLLQVHLKHTLGQGIRLGSKDNGTIFF